MKCIYVVLISDGHLWVMSDEFEKLTDAIGYAMKNNYGMDTKIVKIVNWHVQEL